MDIKRSFEQGSMNKDLDERLVPNGTYIHAENILVDSTEGSDIGVVKKFLSNKQCTQLDLGENVKTLYTYSDSVNRNIYYFIHSDSCSSIIEYQEDFDSVFIVLKDSRSLEERVLNFEGLKEIRSVLKIFSEDKKKSLLIWTDGSDEIGCINIERCKGFQENEFDKDDIRLIKKPPMYSPGIKLVNSNEESNEIKDKFVSFCYRYKYLDGEYSARSPLSYYNFAPKRFEMDYETLENISMENHFNSAQITFNTGDHRVVEIQIIAKFSNSNNLYVVETINKERDGYLDNELRTILYSNKKLYTVLPEDDLYRNFDNVPRKALALTSIGNRLVLGGYTEGYNLLDKNNQPIQIALTPSYDTYDPNLNHDLIQNIINNRTLVINNNSNFGLVVEEYRLDFYVDIRDEEDKPIYQNLHSLIASQNYYSFQDFFFSSEFQDFLSIINIHINNNYSYPPNVVSNSNISTNMNLQGNVLLNLNHAVLDDNSTIQFRFGTETSMFLYEVGIPTSLKSNQDYEVGIVYEDEYKRASTPQTCLNNTLFIPISNSVTRNKLRLRIDNKPPYWAKTFRVALKTKSLAYHNVFVNRFYVEDGYTWAKLEGDNKDKVKEGDYLIVKSTPSGAVQKEIKLKVLEVDRKERDFITGNKDKDGNDIIEEAGLYMKIKPSGFSMGENDYRLYQDSGSNIAYAQGSYPVLTLNLFSELINNNVQDLELPIGSIITLYIKSSHKMESGWRDNILNKTYYTTQYYPTIENWLENNILNLSNLYGNEGNATDNYIDNLSITTDPSGLKGLRIKGTKHALTGGRRGYLDASISVRTSSGLYIFENHQQKEVDLDIFYLSEEVFQIANGNHIGNIYAQWSEGDITQPAVLTVDFFNCYCFGNGLESYKVKDGFNSNFLNIDYSPTTTTYESFREIFRGSDFTWGGVFNEGSGVNKLNEFNLSTANWKELDKQNGAIQLLHSREGNLLVIQDDKWGQVFYDKSIIYSADGNPTLTSTNNIFKDYSAYAGSYGITDVQSFINEGTRCYAVDKKRGAVLRLSMDGLTEITSGMKQYFKNLFHARKDSKVVAGYDPYNKLYHLCIDEENVHLSEVECGQTIIKHNLTEPFEYIFNLNDIMNDIVINYNITSGAANIRVTHGASNYHLWDLIQPGTITIPRPLEEVVQPFVVVRIEPVTESVDISLTNICPLGNQMKLISVVLNSPLDEGLVFSKTLRRSQNMNIAYRDDIVLENGIVSENNIIDGSEGIGRLPMQGESVVIEFPNDAIVTKNFNPLLHKLRYAITDVNYHAPLNIAGLISNSVEVNVTEMNDVLNGIIPFSRPTLYHNLYLIYDLRNQDPILIDGNETINYTPQIVYMHDYFVSDFPVQNIEIVNSGDLVINASIPHSWVVSYYGDSPMDDVVVVEYLALVNGVQYPGIMTFHINIIEV